MVKFKIEASRLITFLEICSMNGVYQFHDKKKVTRPFFESFYLVASKKGYLNVLTINTARETSANFKMNEVDVEEEGAIPITDSADIIKTIKDAKISGIVSFEYNGNIIVLSDDAIDIEIEQPVSEDIKKHEKKDVTQTLQAWREYHEIDENGILVISKRHPMLEVDIPYSLKINLKKSDITRLTGVITNMTKDNSTTLSYSKDVLKASSGQANVRKRLKGLIIPHIFTGIEKFDFEFEFYSLQAIFPNLFSDIIINAKKARAKREGIVKEFLNMYIISEDITNKITAEIAFSSIGKEV